MGCKGHDGTPGPPGIRDITSLTDVVRAHAVTVEVGDVVIRSIPGSTCPWMCEVWVDGVKLKHVRRIELLQVGVGEVPLLKIERFALPPEQNGADTKAQQVAESEGGDG